MARRHKRKPTAPGRDDIDTSWDKYADEYAEEYPMADRRRRWHCFDPVARKDEARIYQTLLTAARTWLTCPRGQCRRARACIGPKVDCFWMRLPAMQRHFLPYLHAHIRDYIARREVGDPAAAYRKPPGLDAERSGGA